ncbi:MAG: archease [Actinomycetota bacterium]|nr:archease [Actinomycetota bacterium]
MHRWTDHTSELGLEVEGESETEVFVEAALALAEVLGDDPRGEPKRHDVELAATDRATLLADWLGEIVYLAETDGLLPERASVALRESRLRATVEGRTATPRYLVKAVTYHGLELTPRDGVWRATVVLDV